MLLKFKNFIKKQFSYHLWLNLSFFYQYFKFKFLNKYSCRGNIDKILKEMVIFKERGFFLEVGAYNGFSESVSLRFEKELKWNGLLIEPNPIHFKYLKRNSKILEVIYPGLEDFKQHHLAKSQMNGFGGIISFFLKADLKKTKKFLENFEVFALAESLGGVESLIEHPAIMTHASVEKKEREKLGIKDNLIRLSVGIEDVDDLIFDIENALEKMES